MGVSIQRSTSFFGENCTVVSYTKSRHDVTTDKVLDLIMLLAKYYIFRCRCLKTIPNFTCFSKEGKEQQYRNMLGVEGGPNYIFFPMVPILPTDR